MVTSTLNCWVVFINWTWERHFMETLFKAQKRITIYKYLQIWLDSHSSVVKNILKWNEMNPMKIKIKLKLLTVFFKKTCTFEDTSDTNNQRLPIKNTIFGHSHIYAPEVWILSWQTLVNNPSISNTMCQKLTPDRR